MTWVPSGQWKQEFRMALVDSYSVQDLQLLVSDYFNADFSTIAISPFGVSKPFLVNQLIEKARQESWLVDLVAAAYERRPKDTTLRQFAEELGLTLTGPRVDNPLHQPFEEIINKNAKFINFAEFLQRAAELQGQICWVDIPDGGGTGFLVGPDLVLTNYHVIRRVEQGEVSPAAVRCRFDYKETLDGTTLSQKQPIEVKLKTDAWLVDWLPPSQFDWNPNLGDAGEQELDYSVIRLETSIGDSPVGPGIGDSHTMMANQKRGWIETSDQTPSLTAGNQVFLLQHPKGQPLQLAVGEVTQFNGNGTRVRYNANSKDGSSGSPCLNADLQLVALHHAYDIVNSPPQWNQAIPIDLIRDEWQKKQLNIPQ